MALFSINGRGIPYQIEFAAIPHDILLLQSSKMNSGLWQSVIEDLTDGKRSHIGPSRIVTCEWYAAGLSPEQLAQDLNAFIRTLALDSVYVVATGDAVDVVGRASQQVPARFSQTLFYPQTTPSAGMLVQAVRDFLRI